MPTFGQVGQVFQIRNGGVTLDAVCYGLIRQIGLGSARSGKSRYGMSDKVVYG